MFGKQKKTPKTPSTTRKTKPIATQSTPYVNYSTIWNSVGGGFSNAGESKVCKVGKYKVLVSRGERLDRYGNPVHTATLINKDGSLGESYRSSGSASLVVSRALKRNGIDTKHTSSRRVKK